MDNNIGRDASELLRKVEAAQFVATTTEKFARLNGRRANLL